MFDEVESTARWIDEYKDKKAIWLYDYERRQGPHARLTQNPETEGLHSDGYFNSASIIADSPLLAKASQELLEQLMGEDSSFDIYAPDVVVGPATGGTKLAEFIADRIALARGFGCRWASAVKDPKNNSERIFISEFDKPCVFNYDKALIVDDVMTSGSTVSITARSLALGKRAEILPFVLTLVNRSGHHRVREQSVLSLIYKPLTTWTRKYCPLCSPESPALRPEENWHLFSLEHSQLTPSG